MIEPAAVRSAAWAAAERPGARIGRSIEVQASIASTNDRARALLDEGDGEGWVVLAEEQTAGRGRRGRSWLSPPGMNLTASIALRPAIRAADAWQLGLATALAVAQACRSVAPAGLKWPNDVVAADDRKVAGLLIETAAAGDRLSGAVVGIGINVNWRRGSMPPEIAEGATSLADLAGAAIDRPALLRRLLEALESEVGAVEAGSSPLDRYRAACVTLGRRVAVATAKGTIEGVASGLDPTGSLVVDAPDGRHVLASGEVIRVEGEGRR